MIQPPNRRQLLATADARLTAHLDQEWAKARDWARTSCPSRVFELSAVLTAREPARDVLAYLDAHQAEAVIRFARLALGQTLKSAFAADPDPV